MRARGVPLVLGTAVTALDDQGIDPARLRTPGLHDIAGAAWLDHPAALAFAIANASAAGAAARPVMICQIDGAAFEHGALYGPGLAFLGAAPAGFVIVSTRSEDDLLWSAEEALGCGDLAALVLRLPARSRKYSFAASRRLHLRAEGGDTPAFVVRSGPEREACAALTQWRISPAPSLPSGVAGKRILGQARWKVALERARTSRPRDWVMAFDHETLRLTLVDPLGDRPVFSRAS